MGAFLGQATAFAIPVALLIWGAVDPKLRGRTAAGRTVFWLLYSVVALIFLVMVSAVVSPVGREP
jgi:hypothetical protein